MKVFQRRLDARQHCRACQIARELGVFDEEHIEQAARCACDLHYATRIGLKRGLEMIARAVYGPTGGR